jgi:hypothetical protein
MTRTTTAAIAATLAVGALITAGCGSSSSSSSSTATNGEAAKSANEILADTQAAAKSASSVHMTISGLPGQFSGATLDLSKGNGATGSMNVGKSTVDITVTNTDFYMKADGTFWKSQTSSASTAQLFAGKWIKIPTSGSAASSLSQVKNLTDMTTFFSGALKPTGTVTKGGTTTVNGMQVVQLKSGTGGSLYVSLEGTPYPVEIQQNPSQGGGLATFTNWNAPVTVSAPANALDFSTAAK